MGKDGVIVLCTAITLLATVCNLYLYLSVIWRARANK